MDSRQQLHIRRRAFTALAGVALPVAAHASVGPNRHAQFVRDLARSYECQHVAVDLDAVTAAFDGMYTPVLGVGTAALPYGAAHAAEAALRDAARVHGMHAIVVIASPPNEARLASYKLAMNMLRQGLHPEVNIVYGGCIDAQLASGHIRVSLLTG